MTSQSSSHNGSRNHVAVLFFTNRTTREVERLLERLGGDISGHFVSYESVEDAEGAFIRTRNALDFVYPTEDSANQDSDSLSANAESASQSVVESLHPLGSEVLFQGGEQQQQGTEQQQN